MMKKLILTLLLPIMTLGAMAQQGRFTLAGEVKGMGPMAFFFLTEADGSEISQQMKMVVNGKLDYSCEIENPGYLMVASNGILLFYLPVLPGEAVTVSGSAGHCVLDGSPVYKEFGEIQTIVDSLQRACWKYDFKADCHDQIIGKTAEEIFDLYQAKIASNYQPVRDFVLSYVQGHPDSEASVFALRPLDDIAHLNTAAACLSKDVLEGRMKPYVEALYDDFRSTSCSFINETAPDITLRDTDSKPLSLSSLRGKWVLVDFWRTSCPPSISDFPVLKELYSKYRDRIEILGVDCESEEAEWRAVVMSTYDLPWMNINGAFDIHDAENPMNIYGITSTPCYFLITPAGRVVKMSGKVKEMETILEILFN